MNSIIESKVRNYCSSFPEEEACGFYSKQNIYPCRNIAASKDNHFIIEQKDFLKASMSSCLEGVFHSHVASRNAFSIPDIIFSNRLNFDFLLFNLKLDKFFFYKSNSLKSDYLLRDYEFGKFDCYSLVQIFYKEQLGIILRDYPRDLENWKRDKSLILKNFEKEGFKEVEELKKFDLIFFDLSKEGFPTSMGIYLDDFILRHKNGRKPFLDHLSEALKKRITLKVRHENFR